MDVELNKPFEDRLQHEVEQFLTASPLGSRPTRPIVSKWISDSWNAIPEEMVVNAWQHIGYCEGIACPHPDKDVEEDNNHHDPLELNDNSHDKDNKAYDTDASMEVQSIQCIEALQ